MGYSRKQREHNAKIVAFIVERVKALASTSAYVGAPITAGALEMIRENAYGPYKEPCETCRARFGVKVMQSDAQRAVGLWTCRECADKAWRERRAVEAQRAEDRRCELAEMGVEECPCGATYPIDARRDHEASCYYIAGENHTARMMDDRD